MSDAEERRPGVRVRPYALTGGRTKPSRNYPVEALVHTERHQFESLVRTPEEWSIAELCRESRSVAEVAALAGLPLGVTRVLIGDLADRRVLEVHTSTAAADTTPDRPLLERVLSGLRNL